MMKFIKEILWGETVNDLGSGEFKRIITSIPILIVIAFGSGFIAWWMQDNKILHNTILAVPMNYKTSVFNMWIYEQDDGGEFTVIYSKKK